MSLRSILTPVLLFCILVAPGAAMGRCALASMATFSSKRPAMAVVAASQCRLHHGSRRPVVHVLRQTTAGRIDIPVLIGDTREYPSSIAAPPAQLC